MNRVFVLSILFVFLSQNIWAAPKTVDQLLRNVNQKSIKKRTTVIKADEAKERIIRRSQPKNVMPTSKDLKVNTTGKDAISESHLNKQIKIMSGLVQKHKTSKVRGELWLRLAELYTQKASYLDRSIQTKFDKSLENWEKNGRKGRRPILNTSSVHKYSNRSIRLCESFLKHFPKDPKMDRVLYFFRIKLHGIRARYKRHQNISMHLNPNLKIALM